MGRTSVLRFGVGDVVVKQGSAVCTENIMSAPSHIDYHIPWQQTDELVACLNERVFVVATNVLDDDYVQRLRTVGP